MSPGMVPWTACAVLLLVTQLVGGLQLTSLFRFDEASSIQPWRSNHDRVMGGVSSGVASWTGESVRFAGELSLENGGGFASFRSQLKEPLDLSSSGGLRLRVRGDGRNWALSLRTGQGRSGHHWKAPFQTEKGTEWQMVTVPFDAFAPSFRGRYARTARPLDTSNIVNIGLRVADGQAGEYTLDVASIDAWRAPSEDVQPGSIAAFEARTQDLGRVLDEEPTAAALLGALGWSERVLVVAEPLEGNAYGKLASIQRGRWVAALEELALRDLRVVHLLGEQAALVAGRQLDATSAATLRDRWGLPAGEWATALVGKDGGVKRRWRVMSGVEDVFPLVDAMPMRRSEALKRSGKR